MKLLKIVFVILILITLGEIGYYFYIRVISNNNQQEITDYSNQREINPIVEEVRKINLYAKISNESLVDENIINYLLSRPKNKGHKIFLSEEVDGFIGEIVKEIKSNSVIIQVTDQDNLEIIKYVIPNDDSLLISLYKTIPYGENSYEPITIDQLKKGDKIKIKHKEDLINRDNPDNKSYEFIVQK